MHLKCGTVNWSKMKKIDQDQYVTSQCYVHKMTCCGLIFIQRFICIQINTDKNCKVSSFIYFYVYGNYFIHICCSLILLILFPFTFCIYLFTLFCLYICFILFVS